MNVINTNDGHFHRCKWLIDNAKGKILDVGCCDGFMFRDRNDLDVTFCDIENQFPESYLNHIKFVQANAENLPFEDKSFDTVIAGDMLEHVNNPIRVIEELNRVGKNVYMTVPNEWEWEERQRPFTNQGHLRFYCETLLRYQLDYVLGINNCELFIIEGGGWSFFCISWSNHGK